MKCVLSEQVYQWQDDSGAWGVGRLVVDDDGDYVTRHMGITCMVDDHDRVLIRHTHTNELEFVEWGKLSPYPASPIPEPENTGVGLCQKS